MVHDGNGNLITEPNKGLTIDYNVLNLPPKITRQVDEESRTIDYIYSGDGTKLQRKTNDDGEDVFTDYVGNFVYEQEAGQRSLKYLITPAGRLLHDSIGNWQWQYNISDHLGNTRAVIFPDYENNVVTEQETHYFQ